LALAGHVAAAEPGASPREAGAVRGKANKGAKPGRPVFYSDIRKPVRVRRDLKENFLFLFHPRPKNFFQLAGSANDKLCAEVLKAFNEPFNGGRNYSYADWLSDNSRLVRFTPAKDARDAEPWTGVKKALEYAVLDIDGDGRVEYIYRNTRIIHGMAHQDVMIVDYSLYERPFALDSDRESCLKDGWGNQCYTTAGMIQRIIGLAHLADEWDFTRTKGWYGAMGDRKSRVQIYSRKNRDRMLRNIDLNICYWNLYRMTSGFVMVPVPVQTYINAPPELLVFKPARDKDASRLQCILMPVRWSKHSS
jgi:hypothetical protein